MSDFSEAIEAMEATGDFRVLRKLQPRSVFTPHDGSDTKTALLLDVETTGLEASDEVIELAMVPFTYGADGQIFEVLPAYQAFNEPAKPITAEITKLTGITSEMVAGQRFDLAQIESIVHGASLVIAHNAAFDRPHAERVSSLFSKRPWACSMSQIDWADEGFEGAKLCYLAMGAGFFYDRHRAVNDCHAAIELLSRRLPVSGQLGLAALLDRARQPSLRVMATGSPFEAKDLLKARGYRWKPDAKTWWSELSVADGEAELEWLRAEVYRHPGREIPIKKITAMDRFSERAGRIA